MSRTKAKQRYRRQSNQKQQQRTSRCGVVDASSQQMVVVDKQTCDGSIRGGAFQICSCGVSQVFKFPRGMTVFMLLSRLVCIPPWYQSSFSHLVNTNGLETEYWPLIDMA